MLFSLPIISPLEMSKAPDSEQELGDAPAEENYSSTGLGHEIHVQLQVA